MHHKRKALQVSTIADFPATGIWHLTLDA